MDALATVTEDKPCRRCGYRLLGLPRDGVCPECGFDVRRSIDSSGLGAAPIDYLRRVKSGVTLLLWALGSLPLGVALVFVAQIVIKGVIEPLENRSLNQSIESVSSVFLLVYPLLPGVLLVIGTFALTTRQPDLSPELDRPIMRWLSRLTAIGFAVTCTLVVLAFAPQTAQAIAPVYAVVQALVTPTFLGCWAGCACFTSQYIRSLAQRDNDESLSRYAHRWSGGLPLLYTVGIMLCFLGPLFGLSFHFDLFHRVRAMVVAALKRVG